MSLSHKDDVRIAVEECQQLIAEFENMNLYASHLLRIETILSARLTFLLGRKAKYQFEQNSAYWIRKIEHSRESIKARNSKDVSNQQIAEHMANLANKEQIEAESMSVWKYEHLKGFCSGVEKVLIAIAHRLRDLASERVVSNNQQG